MDEVSNIIQHKNKYIISAAISGIVACVEFTCAIWFALHCLFSDASSNLIDTLMYTITIWSLKKDKNAQRHSTYLICLIQFVLGLASLIMFIWGCVDIDTKPEWIIILASSGFSFVASIVQTIILLSTKKHGKTTKASFIFTLIGLLSAFCGMLAGATIAIMVHFHINEKYIDIPDLIVSCVFSLYLVIEAVVLFYEAKYKNRNEVTELK